MPREALLPETEPTAWLPKEFSHFITDSDRLSVDMTIIMKAPILLVAAVSDSRESEPDLVKSISRERHEKEESPDDTWSSYYQGSVSSLFLVIFLSLEPTWPFGRVLGKAGDN